MAIGRRSWALEPIATIDMTVLDQNAEYFGISRKSLMENAGRGVASVIAERYPDLRKILVVAGPGNNGGDGLVAARFLHSWGYEVKVVLLSRARDIREKLVRDNLRALKAIGVEIYEAPTPLELLLVQELFHPWADIIVDAILGTGIRGVLREPQATAIDLINKSRAIKVAVDVPSGLDPDTGEVRDVAVKANITVTMHRPKPGLLKEGVSQYVGELIVVDIGIPEELEHLIGPGDLLYFRYARRKDAKKGDYGRIAIVGGSKEFTGAPYLAAKAALTIGVDLATVICPREVARDIRSHDPTVLAIPIDADYLLPIHINEVLRHIEKASVIVIGPGLSTNEDSLRFAVELIEKALRLGKALVIDADGIKAIARFKRQDLCTQGVVLTPHVGEARELLEAEPPKGDNPWVRARALRDLVASRLKGAVVLLKGNVDVITDGVKFKLNMTGNPGMTVGGTGDVLAGVVAALMARIGDPFKAACLGAFITGFAGDLAVEELGFHITPIDVIMRIPDVFKTFMNVRQIVEDSMHDWVAEFLHQRLEDHH